MKEILFLSIVALLTPFVGADGPPLQCFNNETVVTLPVFNGGVPLNGTVRLRPDAFRGEDAYEPVYFKYELPSQQLFRPWVITIIAANVLPLRFRLVLPNGYVQQQVFPYIYSPFYFFFGYDVPQVMSLEIVGYPYFPIQHAFLEVEFFFACAQVVEGIPLPDGINNTCPDPITATSDLYQPVPGNPTQYIQCGPTGAFLKSCPFPLVWNDPINTCDFSSGTTR